MAIGRKELSRIKVTRQEQAPALQGVATRHLTSYLFTLTSYP